MRFKKVNSGQRNPPLIAGHAAVPKLDSMKRYLDLLSQVRRHVVRAFHREKCSRNSSFINLRASFENTCMCRLASCGSRMAIRMIMLTGSLSTDPQSIA
jgi:hypothetical protein